MDSERVLNGLRSGVPRQPLTSTAVEVPLSGGCFKRSICPTKCQHINDNNRQFARVDASHFLVPKMAARLLRTLRKFTRVPQQPLTSTAVEVPRVISLRLLRYPLLIILGPPCANLKYDRCEVCVPRKFARVLVDILLLWILNGYIYIYITEAGLERSSIQS